MMTPSPMLLSSAEPANRGVTLDELAAVVAKACPTADYQGKRVLLIVPDDSRSAPVGDMFKALHRQLSGVTRAFDVLVALGTHPPMTEAEICKRLELKLGDRQSTYRSVGLFNHEWQNPAALVTIGTLGAAEISQLSDGLFSQDVEVSINKRLFDYDQVILIGPVFPHEVVGFSGGNKYLFPGVAGEGVLNFFHWLGAVVTNPRIIGHKWTPVRRVVDKAGALVRVPKLCFCMVVATDQSLAGLYAGTPEAAWDAASELSRRLHITYKEHPFHTILSCAPRMYHDLWTGGKCMYKLEPVLAEGGELIIYAPHITEVSVTHGAHLLEVGYHCRDYFLKQWDSFKHCPWGVLAHSTHVRGLGAFENGVEKCRARVTLATGIPSDVCQRINLGYRDPHTIRKDEFAEREHEGVLLVPKAGEMLFRLQGEESK